MTDKIIVTGGRDFDNWKYVELVLDQLVPDRIVHGGARGADSLAGRWCRETGSPEAGCEEIVMRADWEKYGTSAGPRRNADMLIAHPDIKYVLAFPGGRGTGHMCDIAHKKGYTVMAATDWLWPQQERIIHG